MRLVEAGQRAYTLVLLQWCPSGGKPDWAPAEGGADAGAEAQGSFGRVFLGKWRETTVAIKLLNEPGVAPGADFWDAPDPAALPAAQRCA